MREARTSVSKPLEILMRLAIKFGALALFGLSATQAGAFDATKASRYASPDLYRPNVDQIITHGPIVCAPGAACDASGLSIRPDTGNALRALKQVFSDQVFAANFGVVANDGIDDGPGLRAALLAAQARHAALILPDGQIDLGPGAEDPDALLRITSLMEVRGSGRGTVLMPTAAAGSRSVVLVKPAANAGGIRGLVLRDFSIGILGVTRNGGDGIRIDTTNVNGFVAKPLIDNVSIADAGPGKFAFHHINDPAANLTGGMFGATIRDSDLWGGTKFEQTGDSNNVERNIITGSNIGVDYTAISGAAMHRIVGNNITSSGGAIRASGDQIKISQNQLEQAADYTGSDGAVIVLDNASNWAVNDNNANGYARVDIVLAKNGSTNGDLSGNTVSYSAAQGKVLFRAVGAPGNALGRQRSDVNADDGWSRSRPLVSVDTNSQPTIGAAQALTLQNGWVAGSDPSFTQGLYATPLGTGQVQLSGTIGQGTLTPGTLIAILPPALRPAQTIRVGAKAFGSSGWTLAMLIIDTAGGISVQSVQDNTLVQFDDVTFSRL